MNRIIEFRGEDLRVSFEKYQSNGRTAISIETMKGEPYMTATVNVPSIRINDDEVIIKNYSENEGIHEALMDHGIVGPKLYPVRSNRLDITICKLLN